MTLDKFNELVEAIKLVDEHEKLNTLYNLIGEKMGEFEDSDEDDDSEDEDDL